MVEYLLITTKYIKLYKLLFFNIINHKVKQSERFNNILN